MRLRLELREQSGLRCASRRSSLPRNSYAGPNEDTLIGFRMPDNGLDQSKLGRSAPPRADFPSPAVLYIIIVGAVAPQRPWSCLASRLGRPPSGGHSAQREFIRAGDRQRTFAVIFPTAHLVLHSLPPLLVGFIGIERLPDEADGSMHIGDRRLDQALRGSCLGPNRRMRAERYR